MLASAASQIKLMPDWTFFVQLGIFICAAIVINIFVLGPISKIYALRKKYTWDAEHEARSLNEKAGELENNHEEALKKMLEEEHEKRKALVSETQRYAEKIINDSKKEAKEAAKATDHSIASKERSIFHEMEHSIQEISSNIVSKFMSEKTNLE